MDFGVTAFVKSGVITEKQLAVARGRERSELEISQAADLISVQCGPAALQT